MRLLRVLSVATAVAALVGSGVGAPAAFAASGVLVTPSTGLRAGVMPISTAAAPRSSIRPYAATTPHLTYFGGRVITNVQVDSVLWGSGTYLSQVTDDTAPSMASFFAGVTRSPYLSWLGEYDTVGASPGSDQRIGLGSYAGRTTITPSTTAATVDDTTIQADLLARVADATLPAPTTDAAGNPNTAYAVFFPSGKTITMQGASSGVQFCAYHNTTTSTYNGKHLYYMVLPYNGPGSPLQGGCGASSFDFANLTSFTSHELVETVTDPEVGLASSAAPPLAWYDDSPDTINQHGEIGDICAGANDQGTVTGTDGRAYVVQKEWSNALNACIVQKAGALDHVAVTPSATSAAAGTSVGLSVEGFDASNNSLGDVTGSSTFSISPDGSCGATTCSATTAGSHVITATDGGVSATTGVSFVPAGVDHLSVNPTSSSVQVGGSQAYAVTAYDQYGNATDVTPASTFGISPDGTCQGASCKPALLGSHTVTATYNGLSTGATLTAVDTRAPVATLTRPTTSVTLASSALVSWTGSDVGSGVAKYQLRVQRAPWNGLFQAWQYPSAWGSLTATSLTASGLARGYDYCFSVRALDKAGNASAWTPSKCVAVALDDRSMVASAGWARVIASRFWGSTATVTATRGATLARTGARLDRVGIVATRCPSCGIVAVYVGSAYVGQVNLAASTTSYRAVVMLPRFSLRTGTVTLRVLSSAHSVQVDGLVITPT